MSNIKLSVADIIKVEDVAYCKYCGEGALVSGSYSNHGREYEEELYCSCEGAEKSAELQKTLWVLYNQHRQASEDVAKHQDTVHSSISKLQLESELKGLRVKYNATIVYVLETENT